MGSDRFADRRQEIRRHQGARRLRMVLALTAVSLLAVAAIGLLNSSAFDVDTVSVVGNSRTPADEVVAATGIVTGQPLLDLDVDGAEARVEALAWVRRADVDRRLDGQVVVSVIEREPVLALPAGGRFMLIDQLGYQLELVTARPEEFLPIGGIESSGVTGELAPPETALVLSAVPALTPSVESAVVGVSVVDGDLHLDLTSGGVANLGDSSLLGEKIQALETVLRRVDLNCVSLIDLRVPSAAAVRRSESAEGACI